MLEVCSKISTPQHIATLQADTLGEKTGEALKDRDDKLVKAFDNLSSALLQNNKASKDGTFKGLCY